ncbi:neurogenic locus notch homolog protein 2-like [Symsagittifera roscoffensis]|uniref:neurogenic locus notch homolog protein 2-like n=1 Tax=Symsagittifera roscoffensis TaxID=84072 RepID=UPI00307CC551
MIFYLLGTILVAGPAFTQILKYPGDVCSIELRDNHECLRNTGCIKTGVFDNGQDKRQCMCSEGRILDPTLWCNDCDPGQEGFSCGPNARCETVDELGVNRCVCEDGFVRNFTTNDGGCTPCNEGQSGFDSYCDKGACVGGQCICGVGYLMDPVNKTCIHCDEPWIPSNLCNETYTNTTCFKDSVTNDFTCMCPLGMTYDQSRQCGQCQEDIAECRIGWECKEGRDLKDPSIREKWCYESCDKNMESACDPRATQKTCTVAKLDLGEEDANVCRCQAGYVQADDGTCRSALQQLNCYTCNDTLPCQVRQSQESNYFDTCKEGEFCWTTANWYWNFDHLSWENITYRRECHANPCKNPNEDFCTDDPYHPGHHICVTCCTTGLCNNRVLSPMVSEAEGVLYRKMGVGAAVGLVFSSLWVVLLN